MKYFERRKNRKQNMSFVLKESTIEGRRERGRDWKREGGRKTVGDVVSMWQQPLRPLFFSGHQLAFFAALGQCSLLSAPSTFSYNLFSGKLTPKIGYKRKTRGSEPLGSKLSSVAHLRQVTKVSVLLTAKQVSVTRPPLPPKHVSQELRDD